MYIFSRVSCNFTGATGQIIFLGCKFGIPNETKNIFYKSNLTMQFVDCEFSNESVEALPEKYKSLFD